MKLDRPLAARLCAIALAGYCTIGHVVFLAKRAMRPDDHFQIDRLPLEDDPRVARLRAALPPRGRVGLVSDDRGNWNDFGLYVTQFDVAPVVVVRGAAEPLVIVRFPAAEAARAACAEHGLEVVEDLGGGLLVARRRAP